MNGRRARALRAEAQRQTVGRPLRQYTETTCSRAIRYQTTAVGTDGSAEFGVAKPANTAALAASCTRAVYQHLKRRGTA